MGAEETYIGAVEVVDPKSKYTIANILEGDLNRGDIAYFMSKSEGNKLKKAIKKKKKKK